MLVITLMVCVKLNVNAFLKNLAAKLDAVKFELEHIVRVAKLQYDFTEICQYLY
jgi:hypothetical protein